VYCRNSDGYLVQRVTVNGIWQSETVITDASSYQPSLIQQSDGQYRVAYRRNSDGYLIESIYADQLLCELGAGIIESGTNSNGSWVKFSDGTMEQRGIVAKANRVFESYGGIANAPLASIVFPATFYDVNYEVCGNGLSTLDAAVWMGQGTDNNKTTTAYSFFLMSAVPIALMVGLEWKATGRWKA
jgi:hypothetical protein